MNCNYSSKTCMRCAVLVFHFLQFIRDFHEICSVCDRFSKFIRDLNEICGLFDWSISFSIHRRDLDQICSRQWIPTFHSDRNGGRQKGNSKLEKHTHIHLACSFNKERLSVIHKSCSSQVAKPGSSCQQTHKPNFQNPSLLLPTTQAA